MEESLTSCSNRSLPEYIWISNVGDYTPSFRWTFWPQPFSGTPEEVAMRGWLLKRSPVLGADYWKKVWCILYEDEESTVGRGHNWWLYRYGSNLLTPRKMDNVKRDLTKSGTPYEAFFGLQGAGYLGAGLLCRWSSQDSSHKTGNQIQNPHPSWPRKKICHIPLGFAARVLQMNSKHVPAATGSKDW